MSITSNFMTSILSKIINKKLKKSNRGIGVLLKDVKVVTENGYFRIDASASIKMTNAEFIKILTEGDLL